MTRRKNRPKIAFYFIHDGKLYGGTHPGPLPAEIQPSDPDYDAGWLEAKGLEARLDAQRRHIDMLLASTDALIHRAMGGKLQ